MPATARNGDLTACGASLISGANKTFVNGRLIVRLGDSHDHGGNVVGASGTVFAEGAGVARVGDPVTCPIHGDNVIVTGSSNVITGG